MQDSPNIKCQRCGNFVRVNSKFCVECGEPTYISSSKSESIKTRSNVCQRCGMVLTPNRRFCPECKERFQTPQFDLSRTSSKEIQSTTAQEVINCDLCSGRKYKNPVELVCKKCEVNLCRSCVGLHVSSDPSTLHDITGYKFKNEMGHIKFPCCKLHGNKKCELRCKKCQISICSKCVALKDHADHELEEISAICEVHKSCLRRENKEYELYITPAYEKISSNLQSSIDNKKKSYEKVRDDIKRQGQRLHLEVEKSILALLNTANQMEKEDLNVLSKSLKAIHLRRHDIQLTVKENEKMETDNDAAKIMEYSSKISNLKRVPSLTELSTTSFVPQEVKSDVLANMCGFLIPSSEVKKESYMIEISKKEKEDNK
ncbi:E3 ubiquitin-protein ligase TRIM9-like [Saccostrea cucullata]|uniref:E3 ubiquitin-protein ligase TRIM9-like n=1 Tax=Saccostrea cuccullata TaxID=36930 RepID=UPI002ED475E9